MSFALLVFSLSDDRVDLEAGVGGPGALEKAVLEAGRALDEQHAAGSGRRLHEHAAGVVFRHQLAGNGRNLDGVDAPARRVRRHLKYFVDRRSVGRRHDAPDVDHPAVFEQPQLDRRRPETVADGGHRQVHARIVQHRLGGGDAQDFAIFSRRRAIRSPIGKTGAEPCDCALGAAARVAAVRERGRSRRPAGRDSDRERR